MVAVHVRNDSAIFEVLGWHKLWALKSRIEVPLAHIRAVRKDRFVMRGRIGWRMAGTYLPGVIIAGTYYRGKKKRFYDVCNAERTIVVELEQERYHELIVEVQNPLTTIDKLNPAKRRK
jgi:hypothetical protein